MKLKKLLAVVIAMLTMSSVVALASATQAGAAESEPEMCNGRSDPNLSVVAQAYAHSYGYGKGTPAFVLDISSDAKANLSGTLILDLGRSKRLVTVDWCRAWQHIPGQPSKGSCNMTYPPGAVTAHAVGTAKLNGQAVLVRTDVRKLATGEMLFRVRYKALAAAEATDDCESGWTKVPAEGWDPLDDFQVGTSSGAPGYRMVSADGGVFTFQARYLGSMANRSLNQAVVGIAEDPTDRGYFLASADGGVFAFGNAKFQGSMGGRALNAPVVGVATDPPTNGYWLVSSDGGVFTFGRAQFHGSMAGQALNSPIVGMASDPATGGYWLVAADGGVFSFGAPYLGSMGAQALNSPVVAMVPAPDGLGYWLVAKDGGVFAFGSARFHGSMGGSHMNAAVVGMAAAPGGHGYWLIGADGGVFSFGASHFYGSMSGASLHESMVGAS